MGRHPRLRDKARLMAAISARSTASRSFTFAVRTYMTRTQIAWGPEFEERVRPRDRAVAAESLTVPRRPRPSATNEAVRTLPPRMLLSNARYPSLSREFQHQSAQTLPARNVDGSVAHRSRSARLAQVWHRPALRGRSTRLKRHEEN